MLVTAGTPTSGGPHHPAGAAPSSVPSAPPIPPCLCGEKGMECLRAPTGTPLGIGGSCYSHASVKPLSQLFQDEPLSEIPCLCLRDTPCDQPKLAPPCSVPCNRATRPGEFMPAGGPESKMNDKPKGHTRDVPGARQICGRWLQREAGGGGPSNGPPRPPSAPW